jgi:hypothetical protein
MSCESESSGGGMYSYAYGCCDCAMCRRLSSSCCRRRCSSSNARSEPWDDCLWLLPKSGADEGVEGEAVPFSPMCSSTFLRRCCLRGPRVEGSMLRLLLYGILVTGLSGSYFRRSSATLTLRVVVGDGTVDREDGVVGPSLDPASEGW